jgi:hypothetical protein
MLQNFMEDGIHQTPESGKTFKDMLLFHSDKFFNTEVINLEGANKEVIHKTGGNESTRIEEFEKKCLQSR